jgi:hypothetical protein
MRAPMRALTALLVFPALATLAAPPQPMGGAMQPMVPAMNGAMQPMAPWALAGVGPGNFFPGAGTATPITATPITATPMPRSYDQYSAGVHHVWTPYDSHSHPMAAPHGPLPTVPVFPGAFLLPGQQTQHPMAHHPFAVPHAPLPRAPILHHPAAVAAILGSNAPAPLVGLAGTGRPISLMSLASFPPKKLEAQASSSAFSLRDALGLSQTERSPAAMPNLPPRTTAMRFRGAATNVPTAMPRQQMRPLQQQQQPLQQQQQQQQQQPLQQQFQMAQMSSSAKNPQMAPGQVDGLTGAGFMQFAGVSPGGAPPQMPSSPQDPSGAFDQMHKSWVPDRPQMASSGVPSLAEADRFDGLTGAGFMALSDPAAGANAAMQQPGMSSRL